MILLKVLKFISFFYTELYKRIKINEGKAAGLNHVILRV